MGPVVIELANIFRDVPTNGAFIRLDKGDLRTTYLEMNTVRSSQHAEKKHCMTSVRDNELLTRVGPDTAMGKLMREYWVPALLSSTKCRPTGRRCRIMLLGEKLIAFRDSASGRVG